MATSKKKKSPEVPHTSADIKGDRIIYGVDPSWSCSAFWRLASSAHRCATTNLLIREPVHARSSYERLFQILSKAADFFTPEPSFAAIEGYAFGSEFGREQAGELGGSLRLHLWTQGIPFIVVPPTVLKAYVTGKGNAPKEQIIAHVLKRWGYEAVDNNDADAFALAQFAKDYLAIEKPVKVTALCAKVELHLP
jgi:Holliday junction resolvasome RuvABC endonuclease subunit